MANKSGNAWTGDLDVLATHEISPWFSIGDAGSTRPRVNVASRKKYNHALVSSSIFLEVTEVIRAECQQAKVLNAYPAKCRDGLFLEVRARRTGYNESDNARQALVIDHWAQPRGWVGSEEVLQVVQRQRVKVARARVTGTAKEGAIPSSTSHTAG